MSRHRRNVVIAVRRARHETRRIRGKDGREGACHHVGEFVVLDSIPDVEQQVSARLQHAARLANALALSGKNMTPNWHTTASKLRSSKGSCIASASRHSTGRWFRSLPQDRAWAD
jgi:hypothetical protein